MTKKHESCAGCAAELGGGLCRDNLEKECAAGGGYEAWHGGGARAAEEMPADAERMILINAELLKLKETEEKAIRRFNTTIKKCRRRYGQLMQEVQEIALRKARDTEGKG